MPKTEFRKDAGYWDRVASRQSRRIKQLEEALAGVLESQPCCCQDGDFHGDCQFCDANTLHIAGGQPARVSTAEVARRAATHMLRTYDVNAGSTVIQDLTDLTRQYLAEAEGITMEHSLLADICDDAARDYPHCIYDGENILFTCDLDDGL